MAPHLEVEGYLGVAATSLRIVAPFVGPVCTFSDSRAQKYARHLIAMGASACICGDSL